MKGKLQSNFQISINERVLFLEGTLDHHNAQKIWQELIQVLNSAEPHFEKVCLERLQELSSAAVAVLASLRNRFFENYHQSLPIVNLPKRFSQLVDSCDAWELFD